MSDITIQQVLSESSDPDNPPPDLIRDILKSVHRVAVVGLSRDPAKAARRVPSYLATKGYDLVPVNPHADRILGKKAVGSLDELDEPVDLVLVFRPSESAGPVIDKATTLPGSPPIWLQEEIRADDQARRAREAGHTVIQDLCIFKAHRTFQDEAPRPAEGD